MSGLLLASSAELEEKRLIAGVHEFLRNSLIRDGGRAPMLAIIAPAGRSMGRRHTESGASSPRT